jgi:hypothetical protein
MMNDETAIIRQPITDLADVSALAEQFSKATRLTRYQEGLRDETIRRQKTDLLTFARFLASVNTSTGDFYNDLSAWQGIRAGLLEAFIEWQKLQGYAIGTINVRLATLKAYCHLSFLRYHGSGPLLVILLVCFSSPIDRSTYRNPCMQKDQGIDGSEASCCSPAGIRGHSYRNG